MIGTSTTSSGSGNGSTSRNNSSAIAATNDAIDNAVGISEDALKRAEDLEAQYKAELKAQYDALDKKINDTLDTAKQEIKNAILGEKIDERISNSSAMVSRTIAGGLGLYTTVLGNKDIGFRYCFHNGSSMANSTTYFYASSGGFGFVSYSTPGHISETSILDGRQVDGSAISWGGISRDGDMVIRDLIARKVSVEDIASHLIHADKIIAKNTITNSLVVTDTITGDKIHANSIYASNLREDAMCKELWKNSSPDTAFSA